MFRIGRVLSVDKDKHTARVQFFDFASGDSPDHSNDYPVLVTRPGDYALPAVDADVLCAIEPGIAGIGYVLGAIYSERTAPPLSDAGQRSIASDDLRLGDPAATDKIALAPAVKSELDKVKSELDSIKTAFASHTHLAGALASPSGPVTGSTAPSVDYGYSVGYSPTEPAAENVSAK